MAFDGEQVVPSPIFWTVGKKMYVTLAARPLPKWFHLILSVLLFNLSCAIVYVYIMTRNITASTDKFETVPSYVVAVLFFVSGCLSLSMTKSIINENVRVAQIGVVLSLVTIVISLAAIICTLWLADIQDKLAYCVYSVQNTQCICRTENTTDSGDENLYIYDRITGCNRLDSLNRCMIASIALDSVGAFVCFLAFSNFGLIWARKKTESRRGTGAFNVYGNSSLNGSRRQNGRTVVTAESGGHSPLGSSNSSPVTTPGSHSDWDGWLFSHPFFRQMFTEFRHVWFPPTYEQSVATDGPPVLQHPQNQRRPSRIRSSSPSAPPPPALPAGPILSVALGDYPPPPYSKTPRRKQGISGPKRPDPRVPVHPSPPATSASIPRSPDRVTAT